MTPFEEFIAKNWWYVGTLIVLGASNVITFRRASSDLAKHLDPNNPAPHPNCPVHSALLNEIRDSVKRIEAFIFKTK